MKAGMYWSYATRSLARGGQRTLLAIFCVAVGVLAIVALQLVGNMIDGALTGNVREGNGGDISVNAGITPLSAKQLSVFDTLKSDGTITNYTAVDQIQALTRDAKGAPNFYALRAVDPANFPIAGQPVFIQPSDGNLGSILSSGKVVVTQDLVTQLKLHMGDSVTASVNDGRVAHVTVGGIIASSGYFNSATMLIAVNTYTALPSSSGLPVTYTAIYANVAGSSSAQADVAKKAIERDLPLTTVTTTKDALKSNQESVQNIRYFLQVVGLLALLIGGVGIINTMQVLLRRRRTEIAMLKTAGYRQGDLYALFGLEAALLGLVGGVVGALAGVGVSFIVKGFVERALLISLPMQINPVTVASGVAIGFFTALIFGLLPIVQASQVRPQAVLRDMPEGTNAGSIVVNILLLVLLALLFFGLALSILQNLGVAIGAVAGAGIFLAILSLIFGLIVFGISKLPVLESFRWWYLLLVGVGVALSLLLTIVVPAFGILFLVLSLLGIVVVLLPRTWKANVKMALRNIGRQRVRTVTTLVALFIGVFAIGLILVLGQDIKQRINDALSTQLKYNAYIVAGTTDRAAVEQQLQRVSGIQGQIVNTIAQDVPISVNDTSVPQLLQGAGSGSARDTGRQGALFFLSSMQGYDLTHSSLPDVTIMKGTQDAAKGRNLDASDAGTKNAIMPFASTLAPLNLKLGDTISVGSQDQKTQVTVQVVGFYQATAFIGGSIYTDNSVLTTLSGKQLFYLYSLKIAPKQATQALSQVEAAVPTAQTLNLADLTLFINSLLNNLIVMLTAIASLAMLAGLIIIANAVALAMLERRRELGILKAVGHTSRSVLGEVLLENGIVGFTGGLLAMLLVTLALTVLGKLVFKTDFGVGAPAVLGIVAATALVCMAVAGAVAYQATRVRPLEVLRYE